VHFCGYAPVYYPEDSSLNRYLIPDSSSVLSESVVQPFGAARPSSETREFRRAEFTSRILFTTENPETTEKKDLAG